MRSFKSLSRREKMEYIGIMAIYPLILLYEQIGKSFKFLNSRSKQITASILTVCLMLTMIPVMSLTAFAAGTSYSVYVGGVRATSENADDILGDGTASYDADTNTLNLNGLSLTGSHYIYSYDDLNICLTGTNTITTSYNYGISAGGSDVTFSGSGSLEINSALRGIEVGILTVNSGTVISGGTQHGVIGRNGITVNGGSLVGTGASSYGIDCYSGGIITVNGGTVIASGGGTAPAFGKTVLATENYKYRTSATDGYTIASAMTEAQELTGSYYEIVVTNWMYPASTPTEPFADGTGEENDPYIIATAQQLANMSYLVNNDNANYGDKHYKLSANIDLAGGDWTPVGNYYNTFMGTFDGAYYTISNLTVQGDLGYCGLFGYVSGMINNVALTNANVNGSYYAGGVAGYLEGYASINNCSVSGSISGNTAGGISGYLVGDIYNCFSTATVTATAVSYSANAGGITGYLYAGYIMNSYNAGTVSSSVSGEYDYAYSCAGGIVGFARNDSYVQVINCYNIGTVTAENTAIGSDVKCLAGALAGDSPGSIDNSYWLTTSAATITGDNGGKYYCDSFENADDTVSYNGATDEVSLLEALNAWVTAQNDLMIEAGQNPMFRTWAADAENTNNGYPVFFKPHTHTGVTGEFTVLTDWSQLATSGKYYLGDTIPTVSGNITIASGTNITLCLNGKTLDMGNKYIYVEGTLNICDCGTGGKITSAVSYQGTVYCTGTVRLTGGTVENTGNGEYGNIALTNWGVFTMDGGKLISINGTGLNIDSYTEATYINGGEINAPCGILNYDGRQLYISGGKVISDEVAVDAWGETYIIGSPILSGGAYDLGIGYTSAIFASYNGDTYTGGELTVKYVNGTIDEGYILICDVTEANKDKFTLTSEEYILALGTDENSNNLILVKPHTHAWATDWTNNATHHWHECENADCTVTKDSEKYGYGEHTALADDGNCLTAVYCECGEVMVKARDEHTSTGNNVATYTKKAICDVCSTEYGEKLVDSIAPKGEIKIGDNGWLKFWNTVTFGVFCKDYVEITITGADAETGVAKIEYYLSDTAISDTEIGNVDGWQTYTDKINITANDKRFVYAKITDNAGNVTYLSVKGGVVVFKDTEITTGEYEYTLTTKTDIVTNIKPGNNTVNMIDICEPGGNAGDMLDYFINTDGYIVLKGESLEDFTKDWYAGDYTVTVMYNALGEAYGDEAIGDKIADTVITLTVHKADGKVDLLSDISKTYDGVKVGAPLYNKLGTGEATIEYKVKGADDSTYTTTAPKDAGDYTVRVTVASDNTYKEAFATADFTIYKANFTAVVEQEGSLIYNGDEQLATVKATESGVNAEVTYKYGLTENECDSVTVPAFKNADTYIVYYTASCPNFNDCKGSFEVKIDPKTLTVNDFSYIGGELFKVYDGTTAASLSRPVIITAVSGLQGADVSPNITVFNAVFDSANAGDRILNVSVEGNNIGNYVWNAGIVQVNAEILVKYVLNPQIVLSQDVFTFSGNEKEPIVKVYDGDMEIPASEYTVGYIDNINAGVATVMINDKTDGNFEVEGSKIFVIVKADPETDFPTDLSIAVGKKLSDITLPEGYTWDNPDTVVAYGTNKYDMTYVVPGPYGTINYNPACEQVEVKGLDVTAPTGEITLKDNKWTEFLNGITFGLFFKETQEISITAADTESGVKEIAYYLATEELSIDDVKALGNDKWTVYTDTFNVEPDNKYVVYARITDNAGNIIYINSDGIVLDSIKPVIAGVEDGKAFYGDATFTVDEAYLDTVTLDGEPIEVKDGKYSVPADNKEHTIVVTDKTGNQVTYKLTVYKNYKVSFVVDGKEIEASEVGYGKDATLPEIPAKEGYTAKWDVDGKNITDDTVITAEYEKLATAPDTGDSADIGIWMMVLLISGLTLFGTVYTKKRKDNNA